MTLYFYDLETSGVSPRHDRVMQFAGQRTDENLNPIGAPDNILIKLTPDTLPQPDAVLITGITPQQTHLEGITEAEFLKHFFEEICTGDTVFIGFNNIRFDDEFMRFMMWRNFYDAYEWQWKDNCSRWDMLDVVRMTRALRPEGIKWPVGPDGKPSNRLEFLSSINGLDHASAHDALSDVNAVIALADLIKRKQPKLFSYLFNIRGKTKVEALITQGEPVIYTSGRYPAEYEKTTTAVMIGQPKSRPGAFMFDLRHNPKDFIKLSVSELTGLWSSRDKDAPVFPVKLLSYNKSPAIAPLGVADTDTLHRLGLNLNEITNNFKKMVGNTKFAENLAEAYEQMIKKYQPSILPSEQEVDCQLYDGFVGAEDKIKMSAVRAADPPSLDSAHFEFNDTRLNLLLPLYKARNFPKALSEAEIIWWEKFRTKKLFDGEDSVATRYFRRLSEISETTKLDDKSRYLIEELNLYGQSILPSA